ncbi:hypothetical protein [Actinomycetospora sp.]|uniref:hypothetical protein n=1 Tax=Actinomycetospora sp. TaxID=1872135 RepID=UPI002F3F5FEB
MSANQRPGRDPAAVPGLSAATREQQIRRLADLAEALLIFAATLAFGAAALVITTMLAG